MTGPDDYLKRHRPTNLALMAAALSALMLVLAVTSVFVPRDVMAARGDPRYWLFMAPLVVWGWGVATFDAWAVRVGPWLLAAAPLGCLCVALFLGVNKGGGEVTALWILTGLSVLASSLGMLALRRSPLWPFHGGE